MSFRFKGVSKRPNNAHAEMDRSLPKNDKKEGKERRKKNNNEAQYYIFFHLFSSLAPFGPNWNPHMFSRILCLLQHIYLFAYIHAKGKIRKSVYRKSECYLAVGFRAWLIIGFYSQSSSLKINKSPLVKRKDG